MSDRANGRRGLDSRQRVSGGPGPVGHCNDSGFSSERGET